MEEVVIVQLANKSVNGITNAHLKDYGRTRVPVREIVIDTRYQRAEPTPAEIATLQAKWDDRAAGIVTLSMRHDGRVSVVSLLVRTMILKLKSG
jgi:hypothetical protein